MRRRTAGSASATRARSSPRGLVRIVKQTFAAVLDKLRQAREGRCDDGESDGHVLEHLERRPVEAESQRRVPCRVERARLRYQRRQERRAAPRAAALP